MLARRILLFVTLLLLVAVISSAIAPEADRPRTLPGAAPSAPAPRARVVTATLPTKREVHAQVGDVVRLQVRGTDSDEVQIVDLGVHGPVEPDLPAELTFTADQVGRFEVTLRDAGVEIGTVVVQAAPAPSDAADGS